MSTLIERMNKYYIPEPNSGCWLWTAAVDGRGYPVLNERGKIVKAHRLSYSHHNGIPIPPSHLFVCHKCDVPSCINPAHLFLGTHQDNHKDMMRKGRHGYKVHHGVDNVNSKLNDELVRKLRSDKRPRSVIAQELGVSKSLVYQVRVRKIWKHVI